MVDGLRKKMPNEPFKILRLRRVPSWNTTWLIAGIHGNPRDNHPDYPWSRIGSIPPKCSSSISMPLADLSENRKRHSSRFIRSWLVQTQIPLIMSLIIWNIGILDSTTPKKKYQPGVTPSRSQYNWWNFMLLIELNDSSNYLQNLWRKAVTTWNLDPATIKIPGVINSWVHRLWSLSKNAQPN